MNNDPIEKLSRLFSQFPGVGLRQSKRFVHFLIQSEQDFLTDISTNVLSLKKNISQCPTCFCVFAKDGMEECEWCSSSKRDKTILMVVEKQADYESMKKSKCFDGSYFILGSLSNPLSKELMSTMRLKELKERITKDIKNNNLSEVILAFPLTNNGEYTDHVIRNTISSFENIKITSLGRGLSTGTEIEYSDDDTLKNALKNRI